MLCVIAKLDNEAAEKLAFIRKAAVPEEMAALFHGHITIVTYIGNDEAQFIRIRDHRPDGSHSSMIR